MKILPAVIYVVYIFVIMISRTTLESQNRLQSYSDISNQTSTMRINLSKTVRMTIAPKTTVTKTTEADINADEETF